MATSGSHLNTGECGIIILGNAGSGKSFLCNVLLDSVKFDSKFSVTPVTLTTENAKITVNGSNLQIFNIPGLIERKQERIDKNKQEIINAFQTSEKSIVIYVWSHDGGRIQPNDLIAFKALYEAYQFPLGSLIYVINKIPGDENNLKFQAEFLVELKEGLLEEQNLTVDPKDAVFIELMDFKNEIQRAVERKKLLGCVEKHTPAVQQKKTKDDIILQADKLKQMRVIIDGQIAAAKEDKENYERKINAMEETIRCYRADAIRHQAEPEQGRENYERKIGSPPDPATLVIAASTGAVVGAVRGLGTGLNAVVDPISNFAGDRDIPLPVRVALTPLATIGGVAVAPIAAVGGAVVGAAEGIADGVKAAFSHLF